MIASKLPIAITATNVGFRRIFFFKNIYKFLKFIFWVYQTSFHKLRKILFFF